MPKCKGAIHGPVVNTLTKLEAISLPIGMKKDIQSALTKVMVHDTSSQKVNGSTIESLSPYLTQAECNHFASLHVLAKSLAMLKEDTKKQAIGILIHVSLHHGTGYEMPSGIARRTKVQDFAKVFHTTPSVPSMVTTHKFPADPTLLGADWLTAAYGQDDKPATAQSGRGKQ